MIKQISLNADLLKKLFDASHGAFTKKEIVEMEKNGLAIIIKINDRLTTGISFSEDAIGFFGFHGEMHKEDLDELDDYSITLANDVNVSKVQFLSPRKAWDKLLKPMNYKTTLIVYTKEI